MTTRNGHAGAPRLGVVAGRLLRTLAGAAANRGELFALEMQQEKSRAMRLIASAVLVAFFAMLMVLLLTGTIIFIIPQNYRVYAAGGFAFIYLVGTVVSTVILIRQLRRMPFSATVSQLRKDREIFEAI